MISLQENLKQMKPAAALAEIAQVLGELLSNQDDGERVEFLRSILGSAGETKVGSMVNL